MSKPQLRTISAAEFNRIKSGKEKAIKEKLEEVTSAKADWSMGGLVALIGFLVLVLGSCTS